jgi:hypothetical protein
LSLGLYLGRSLGAEECRLATFSRFGMLSFVRKAAGLKPKSKWFHGTLAILFLTVATWVFLEVCLIIAEPYLFKGIFQYNSDFGFQIRPGAWGSNEFGFNDKDYSHQRPDDTFRIVVLGDSFNWIGGQACNYPRLAEKKLKELGPKKKIEIINAGYPSIGPPVEAKILKKYVMAYQPNLVILGFFAGNDFGDSDPAIIRVAVNALPVDIPVTQHFSFFGRLIAPISRVYQLYWQLQQINEQVNESNSVAQALPDQCHFPENTAFTEDAYQKILEHKLGFIHQQTIRLRAYRPHIQAAEDAIAEMSEFLKAEKVDFKVLIIPDELQVDAEIRSAAMRKAGFKPEDILNLYPQQTLQEILQKRGIESLDLYPSFVERMNADPKARLYLERDTHLNLQGTILASDQMAEWLKPSLVSAGIL